MILYLNIWNVGVLRLIVGPGGNVGAIHKVQVIKSLDMGFILRKPTINTLRIKTWIDELRQRFPDCPNPTNYPNSAQFYLNGRKFLQNRCREK